ncbi:hypothetical protein ACFPYJ_30915 [Paenibacillus solisilvae]|uniref:Uncharacterized protein n=1 Tax=Paenibacillus solisilvae TaxID=2486751 RepID=A0ABW0W6Y9_9BACL
MKTNKILVFSGAAILLAFIICYWVYSNKFYYPTLPFERITKKEAVWKLENGNHELVELEKVNGYYWLGFKGNQQEGRDKINKKMEDQGLNYDSFDGNGIFFEKEDRVIITGTMWTRNYVLYKVPAEVMAAN